uniref:Uncharacterized protein n=1 Tax=Aegilops tauschii subsp. strangulata TaxID=200361 RepID=A0A453S8E3_AEGTS
ADAGASVQGRGEARVRGRGGGGRGREEEGAAAGRQVGGLGTGWCLVVLSILFIYFPSFAFFF